MQCGRIYQLTVNTMNGILSTNWTTIGEAVLTAVVAAVLVALYGDVTTVGFNVLTADWGVIGSQMLNIGVIAGVTILGKDLLSTNSGALLGVGPTNG